MNLFFQCLGITGLIMILYGLLAFAITRVSSWFFWSLIAAGGAMVLAFLISSFSRRPWVAISDLYTKRSVRHGANAALYTVLVVGIVVVANVLSQDYFKRIDLTENKVNTLTDQSEKIAKGLDSPVKVTAFLNDQNPQKNELKSLFQSYQTASSKFEYVFVDPDKERPLAVKYGANEGDVAVEYEGKHHLTKELTEQGITQAILKVTRKDKPTVCFTSGHGELDLEGPDEDARGLSAIKGGIENEGYTAKKIESVAGGVAPDCAMLVVAGPTQAFAPAEADVLHRFLESGGKAVFLLDPNVPDPRLTTNQISVLPTGLEAILEKWGAKIGTNVILEKHMELFRGMQIGLTVYAETYGDHPIVDPLKKKRTVFQNARSVLPAPGFDGTVVKLISSAEGDGSWAESDVHTLFRSGQAVVDAKDLRGPVPLALAIEREGEKEGEKADPLAGDKQTRVFVAGDADFISNGLIRSYPFNFDLFLNTLNWLAGEADQISIRPKRIRTSAIELTPEQSNIIFYVAIVTIPMLVLIFGMDLWWIRRRRG